MEALLLKVLEAAKDKVLPDEMEVLVSRVAPFDHAVWLVLALGDQQDACGVDEDAGAAEGIGVSAHLFEIFGVRPYSIW